MRRYLIFILLVFILCGCASKEKDVLFQVSTIDALLAGNYDGVTSFKEIRKHGDFGIGTFENLDGEMAAMEGEYYQVKSDGTVSPVNDSLKSPFAAVAFFKPEVAITLNKEMNYQQLTEYLDSLLPQKNVFYAVEIEGEFKQIKSRSVSRQNKPYPVLAEAVKNQSVFQFSNINGTLMGFWCPDSARGIEVPGYHLHFISRDKNKGGHLLDCLIEKGVVKIEKINRFFMVLPEKEIRYANNPSADKEQELEKVEKGK